MATNKFSKLQLDSSKVPSMINNWCELNLEGEFTIDTEESKQQILYTINGSLGEIKLILYKAAGGTYTISPNTGKNPDVSILIAEDIYDHINSELVKSPYANGFSMKMQEDDFLILIDMIKEYEDIHIESYSKQDEEGKAKFEQYRLKSDLNDSIVVKYYKNTNRIQIQGKPLYLFNEITSLICNTEENADAVVDAHIKLCELTVEKEELNDELKAILGEKLYNYLNATQKAMLNSSLVLSKVKVNGLDEYSYIIIPALKAYDGFFAKELTDAGISLTETKSDGSTKRLQFTKFFTVNQDGIDCVMKEVYTNGLDEKMVDIFQKMYNYYRKDRNPHMHATESDATTKIIGTYEEALERLNSIVLTMKEHYCAITAI